MNCFACGNNLSAYVDDELTPEQRREVESHLDGCETCRAEYETHLAAWELAGDMRTEAAPDDLWKAVEAELHQQGLQTTPEDLALIVRGLAGEVRDLKHVIEGLRRNMEAREREEAEQARARQGLGIWTDPGVGRTRSQMG